MNEFEAAATRAEREVVIERLREEGFATQAQHLEQFVEEGGPDRSKEEREDR